MWALVSQKVTAPPLRDQAHMAEQPIKEFPSTTPVSHPSVSHFTHS